MSKINEVLERLKQDRRVSIETLARDLDMPRPSVRRAVGQLRREGFNISFAESGRDGGEYELRF